MPQLQSVNPPNFKPSKNSISTPSASSSNTMSGASMSPSMDNPLTKPTLETATNFLPSGRVEEKIGNLTFNLSPEEYKSTLNDSAGGLTTPQVQAYLEAKRKARIEGQTLRGKAEQNVKAEVLTKNAILNQNEPLTIPQAQPEVSKGFVSAQQMSPTGEVTPGSFASAQIQNTAKLAKPIGVIYDFAQSLFSGGKGLQQKEAEATIADIKTSINQDIEAVKLGLKDPSEMKFTLQQAVNANQRLANSVKGANMINLRYFVTQGKDVETQVELNKRFLEDKIRQVNLIELQNQIKAQTANI